MKLNRTSRRELARPRRKLPPGPRSIHRTPRHESRRAMATSKRIDARTFLGYLRQSGLVEPPQLDELARRHADRSSGRSVARALVEEGVLTRFQAERLLMGRTVGFQLGQYRILEQLGRGGMGKVYRAEHRTMQRIVALKVLTT